MSRLADAVLEAQLAGILPADATVSDQAGRPWPVVLLTGLGAWLAALPILGVLFLAMGDHLLRGAGRYVVGAMLAAGALAILRRPNLPLFVEQVAVPALLAGTLVLGFGLFDGLGARAGSTGLALLAFAIGFAVPQPWLRVIWGGSAAALAGIALMPEGRWFYGNTGAWPAWIAAHVLMALWLVLLGAQRAVAGQDRGATLAAALEALATGWVLVTLAGLATASGMTFLAGGAISPELANELARDTARLRGSGVTGWLANGVSVLLALAGTAVAARAWPTLRQPAWLGVALVLTALCGFLPALGAVLLALALLATSGRALVGAAAGVAAAWIVGSFYYALRWPLSTKAAALAGAGALLCLLGLAAWQALRRTAGAGTKADETRVSAPSGTADTAGGGLAAAPASTARATVALPHAGWLVGLATLATLVVANVGIWQKERLIANGERVYVAMAPVDPRSLMQGDYMRLAWRLPPDAQADTDLLGRRGRPHAVGTRDTRGILALTRIDRGGGPLQPGEFRIELTPKEGRWVLVSDAWFFREGDAERWAAARYGEFRVTADGQALLVGMADNELRAIRP